jgi:glycosyltransferase involved in cell wall biosynthesis
VKRPTVLVLGPDRARIGGVETHLNLLLDSSLAQEFDMRHFEVGSRHGEGRLAAALRLARSPLLLAAEIARSGAAIVHVNTSLSAKPYWRDLMYVAAAKLCGARVVYQVHGGSLRELARPAAMGALLRATLQWPDVIVVLARCELDDMRELVPQQNVVLLPNAIDCRALVQLRRPVSRGPLKLIFLGRLVRAKGVFETVQALGLAAREGVNARLVIAGDGPDEEPLKREVRRLGLEAQVDFAGPALGPRKLGLLADAEVFLLPTYHREGLPYALLEAMAAGLVPVVTRVAAIPDVVAEGAHGVFVPPRDPAAIARALASLAADRERLARMGVACRERAVTAYSIERLAADFRALYTGVCGAATPREAH